MSRIAFSIVTLAICVWVSSDRKLLAQTQAPRFEYRVLATSKTSTMEKELNEAAEAGFRFQAFMGGETAFGGDEVVAVLVRGDVKRPRFAYKLLATAKTSTMLWLITMTASPWSRSLRISSRTWLHLLGVMRT